MSDPILKVSEPGVTDAGCWGLVRRYTGSLWGVTTNCGKRARVGALTCTAHAHLDDAARELQGLLRQQAQRKPAKPLAGGGAMGQREQAELDRLRDAGFGLDPDGKIRR